MDIGMIVDYGVRLNSPKLFGVKILNMPRFQILELDFLFAKVWRDAILNHNAVGTIRCNFYP